MKKIIFLILMVIILTSCTKTQTDSVSPANEEIITESEINVEAKMELMSLDDFSYYLYSPKNPKDNMSLIVYLHGGTNKKESVDKLLTLDGFPKYLYDGYYEDLNAYVLVPKLDSSYKGWTDIYTIIKKLIDYVVETNNIDSSKIALTGHSMGGTGTFQLQCKLPNIFSCIAPMSGSITDTVENIENLSKTKIWAFVGSADTIVKPESTLSIIAKLKENGVDANVTSLDGATHFDVPSLAYKNRELINWLVNCGNI